MAIARSGWIFLGWFVAHLVVSYKNLENIVSFQNKKSKRCYFGIKGLRPSIPALKHIFLLLKKTVILIHWSIQPSEKLHHKKRLCKSHQSIKLKVQENKYQPPWLCSIFFSSFFFSKKTKNFKYPWMGVLTVFYTSAHGAISNNQNRLFVIILQLQKYHIFQIYPE